MPKVLARQLLSALPGGALAAAGTNYRLKLKVTDAHLDSKFYQAQVWGTLERQASPGACATGPARCHTCCAATLRAVSGTLGLG